MAITRASLLIRVRNPSDSTAWNEFDAIYRPLLHRYARLNGLADADAEDVVQHCMVAVHKHIKGFEYDPTRGRFKGWLRTLVNNRVRNLARDRREQQAGTAVLAGLSDGSPTPEEAFDDLWLQEHIRHALEHIRKQVEEQSYRAYELYVVENRSADEVCAELNINRNQLYGIKWRMNRKLNERMAELLGNTTAHP